MSVRYRRHVCAHCNGDIGNSRRGSVNIGNYVTPFCRMSCAEKFAELALHILCVKCVSCGTWHMKDKACVCGFETLLTRGREKELEQIAYADTLRNAAPGGAD
jgi:hypothetical protein